MAARASFTTTLAVGQVQAEIGLFKTLDKQEDVKWETAGPNGGALRAEKRATGKKVTETENAPVQPVQEAVESEPGEYKTVLVEDATGFVIEPDEVRKGFWKDETFFDCTDQIAAITEATKLEEARVVAFIPLNKIPAERVIGSYFVGAKDENAPKVLRLFYEAMKATQRAAVVKVTKTSRQTLGIIRVKGDALVLLEVAWSEDWRQAEDIPRVVSLQQATVTEREVEAATELVKALSDPAQETIDGLRDDARALRDELVEAALAGDLESFETPEVEVVEDKSLLALLEEGVTA